MKRRLILSLALMMLFLPAVCAARAEEPPAPKVILDTDMSYASDDAYCLYALLQADAKGLIDLMGCTVVGGYVTAAEAALSALRQLELLNRADVPVYIGTDVPLMGLKSADFYARNGLMMPGAVATLHMYDALDYRALPDDILNFVGWSGMSDREWGETALSAQDAHAAVYMVEQARKYPGEITIIAIGACTNVALACRLDARFAQNVRQIIYMGGAIDVPGNVSAYAEMNWFHDPEAAQICLTAGFARQVLVPHDISFSVSLDKRAYDMLKKISDAPCPGLILRSPLFDAFETDEDASLPMWDLVTVVPLLNPALITRFDERFVRVDTRGGATYGLSMSRTADGEAPEDTGLCEIIYAVDQGAFWDYMAGLYAHDAALNPPNGK